MKYQLSIRKIKESDLSVNRPFMPENENYELYLLALAEDIKNLHYVSELIQSGNDLLVTIKSDSDFEQLHSYVKKLLTNQFHDKLVANSGFKKLA